jgi:magnesium-transporting ATPase (P-type)
MFDEMVGNNEEEGTDMVIKNRTQVEREYLMLKDKEEQSKQTEKGH